MPRNVVANHLRKVDREVSITMSEGVRIIVK